MTPKLSERTLRNWRKEALIGNDNAHHDIPPDLVEAHIKNQGKILQLTQELLDNYLIARK